MREIVYSNVRLRYRVREIVYSNVRLRYRVREIYCSLGGSMDCFPTEMLVTKLQHIKQIVL